jgi:Contractile injection system tape measure protein
MAGSAHSITLQKVTLHAPDEKVALALQPALAGINDRQFLPVIEQVFDEFDRPGSEILIERLTLDLGTVPLESFPGVAAGRLREALRAELARILAGTAPDAEPGTTILDEDAAEIAILEHYLQSGLWPNWAPRPAAFDLDSMVLGIAGRQPAELGTMLYRIGSNRAVLERLVAQLDEATLERLVEALEPQHAALIVGTIAESKLAHKTQPVVDMSEDTFADQVWLMTLNYLVAEPGTQFNRREFVKSLLHGMAEQAGAQYGDILSTLRRALQQVAQRRPLRSSLPAILLELAREEGQETGGPEISLVGGEGEAGASDIPDVRRPSLARVESHAAAASPADAALHRFIAAGDTAPARALRRAYAQHDWEDVARIFTPPPGQTGRPAAEFAALAEIDAKGMAAVLADADAIFRRYDAAEALIRLVRAGIRGDADAPSAAGMSRGEIITGLLELPAPAVRAAMTQAFAGGQRRAMQRFLSGVPERAIVRLLRALLPTAMVHGTPFFESVQAHAAEAVDQLTFYADLMIAILKGKSIDFDELVGRAAAGVDGAAAKQGAARITESAAVLTALHALMQALPRELRPRDERLAVILRSDSDALQQRRPIDVEFIAQLMGESLAAPLTTAVMEALRDSLQGLSRTTDFTTSSRALLRAAIEQIAGDIEPDIVSDRRAEVAAVLAALHALSQTLPRKFRRSEDQNVIILPIASDALRQRRSIDAKFIARLLRESLAAPLTTAAVEALRRSMDDLSHAAKISPRARALLRAAIEQIGKEAQRRMAPHRRVSKAEKERTVARDAAAAFLASGRWAHKGKRSIADSALAAAVVDLIAHEPARAAAATRAGMTRRKTLAAWSRRLPEPALARLIAMLEPRRHRSLLEVAESLGAVLQQQLVAAGKPAFGRRDLWNFVLGFAAVTAGKSWSVRDVLAAFMREEVAPRLEHVALFEDMLQAVTGGEELAPASALAAASAPSDAAQDHAAPGAAALPDLLQANPPADRQRTIAILLDSLASRSRREAVSGALSERQFATALALLEPHRHKTLLETGQLLFAALTATDKRAAALYGGTQPLHKFLFDFVAGYRGRSWSAETLVREFFRHVASGYAASLGQESEGDALLQSLLAAIGARAATAGMTGMAPALHRLTPLIMSRAWLRDAQAQGLQPTPKVEAPVIPAKPRPAFRLRRPDAAQEKPGRAPIYIDNAGLVLATPFIPHLFRELGMLEKTEGDALRLKEPATATRAVHLQQYLVNSRTATPEPLLALNKILAGVPLGAVVGAHIEATERELELCGKVLASMLANWPALSTGTSPAGLQNTFMQREGRLTFDGDRWLLKVERKTLDILVDQVPWSFRMIFHSWMPQPLHVEW